MVRTQNITIRSNQTVNQTNQQQLPKKEKKNTNQIAEKKSSKHRNEFYVNNDFVDTQNKVDQQVHTTTQAARILSSFPLLHY